MRPIETRYAGYRFRSRTEALWAIFFKTLGIRWDYEVQGYLIGGKRPYLPDFKLILPGDRIVYAEVKDSETDLFEGEHIELCRALSRETGCPVLLLTGPPACRLYQQLMPWSKDNEFTAAFFADYGPLLNTADGYWLAQAELNEETGALEFPHDARAMRKAFGQGFIDAMEAARSARFEHGEKP